MPASSPLSPAALRLFDGYHPAELASPEATGFVLGRLLEEGDSADLRAAVAAVGESGLARAFAGRGRQLSARSRIFWGWLLGCEPPKTDAGNALWPLA